MARRIVKQPDGLLSVWSTVVDNFIITDATKEELIEDLLKEEMIKARINIEQLVETPSEIPYDYFLRRIEEVHGKQEEEEKV